MVNIEYRQQNKRERTQTVHIVIKDQQRSVCGMMWDITDTAIVPDNLVEKYIRLCVSCQLWLDGCKYGLSMSIPALATRGS